MKRICFYTSDYGYGHAARDIAIIRGLQGQNDFQILVKTSVPFLFMKKSLPSVGIFQRKNDVGVFMNGAKADVKRTGQMVDGWVDSWDGYIAEETSFCETEKIDLILSDIVPQPFLVAGELGIPGIGISNFTWHFIYSHLLGQTESVQRIREAYEMVGGALVLPFNEEMALFKSRQEISLISRKITQSREDLRRKHGISKSCLLVYLGLGKSLNSSLFRLMRHIDGAGMQFLISSGTNFPLKNVIRIPSQETETQNYIAMCDLVVSKAGYSTVSEAIRAGVPMCIFGRDGYEEDRLIANRIEDLGIGRKISEEQFLEGEWRDELDRLEQYRSKYDDLDFRYRNDGLPEAMSYIREAVF